ncbi:MAG: peptide chain release factor N(5)-glutamine methyltransferase [Selenomonadaceae bacterium]
MAQSELWTIGSIIKWTEQYFGSKGVESPRLDAEVLLSYVLKKERIYLYVHFDEPLEPGELAVFREMVKQRVLHVPVAYIIGYREFMGLTFKVSPAVLVPRPDTEILVQAVLDRVKDKIAGAEIADIGTGSGAVVLSLLKYIPDLSAVTVDISLAALAIAKENSRLLEVDDRVAFYEGDVYAPLAGQKLDVIVSNPPYIPDADIAGLAPEVRDNEPHMALAGGRDGLDFYRRLVREGAPKLKNGGFLAFEVGIHQAKAVAALAENEVLLGKTEIIKDYAGIERVVIIWKA